jgi:hypothetical protein
MKRHAIRGPPERKWHAACFCPGRGVQLPGWSSIPPTHPHSTPTLPPLAQFTVDTAFSLFAPTPYQHRPNEQITDGGGFFPCRGLFRVTKNVLDTPRTTVYAFSRSRVGTALVEIRPKRRGVTETGTPRRSQPRRGALPPVSVPCSYSFHSYRLPTWLGVSRYLHSA